MAEGGRRENKGVVNSNRDQEITERISNITRVSSKRISKSINSSNFRLLLTFNIRILQYLEKILLIVVVVAFSFRTTIFYRIEYTIANRRVAIANFKIVTFATKGINYAKREGPVNEPINECNHV